MKNYLEVLILVRNFRDLSQYLDKNGKHLPEGKFLRSAALTELKVKDVEHLCKYNYLDQSSNQLTHYTMTYLHNH